MTMHHQDRTRNVLRAYLEANRRVQAEQTSPSQYIPVTVLNSFLGIVLWGDDGRGEPVPQEVVAEKLGISPTTFSTHLRYLGDKYRPDKEGLGLIEQDIYPLNRRMKVVRLTRKGRALADQLAYILQGVLPNADKERPE